MNVKLILLDVYQRNNINAGAFVYILNVGNLNSVNTSGAGV